MSRESSVKSFVQLGGFLSVAKPGAHAIYHTGSLMHDRQTAPALHVLAEQVALAGEVGLVILTQRIGRAGVTHYVATRTGRKGSTA